MPARQHKNIPIFIPHMGCPHRCVFCDQCAISGQSGFDIAEAREQIEAALATLAPDTRAEIAYFGGSFTAIDRRLMIDLLDLAQDYVDAGRVSGIRFSTRPDAVGEDVLDVLSHYTVAAVELGLQSMDDEVLRACRRGHTADEARAACRRIVARGYSLVGQMMLGLPSSNADKEMATAREICDLGATAVRVYPAVVFDGTALGEMLKSGQYTPLSDAEAAERCAPILALLEERGVQRLRVGLCASETLSSSRVLGGANHSALGEMCYSTLFRRRMSELLDGQACDGRVAEFSVSQGKTSQAIGQKRQNVRELSARYGLAALRIREDDALVGTQVRLTL
ncbi:MAG: radical SAM protein, partial [Clostridia bacterium]|nr:radical SAM protein [Clostridia bacterium]